MLMLYDSESFVVLHMRADNGPEVLRAPGSAALKLPRHGFEIVDKRSGKGVYLDGSWAEMFQKQILAWQRATPSAREVEEALERYTGLAQQPIVIH